MSASKKSTTKSAQSDKASHFARFHKSPQLARLVKAHDELEPLVVEAETARRACLQTRSELFDGKSKRPEREQEDRCLYFYAWVLRLEAVIDPLRESINSMREALGETKEFLGKENNWKRKYDLCKLLELNAVTAVLLLKRALKAFSETEYGIHDATFEGYLAQLLGNRAAEGFDWLDGVPKLPVSADDETEWAVIKSDRTTARMVAHLLSALERLESGGCCIPVDDNCGEASSAARLLRGQGWNAFVQDRTSPGMSVGLQVNKPRKAKSTK